MNGRAYYNENDPFAAAWLRELIGAGLIADGDVDERSIVDVRPDDVRGYTQCHFFAGIGGWSAALRIARWDDVRPVWTGSCPCQDFSSIGKQKGHSGARNLWPEMLRLIRQCNPAIVFGEQVDNAIKHGWLDGVFVDLEAEDYACGSAVLPVACAGEEAEGRIVRGGEIYCEPIIVGAPHVRHRIYWVANTKSEKQPRAPQRRFDSCKISGSGANESASPGRSGCIGGLANSDITSEHERASGREQQIRDDLRSLGGVAEPDSERVWIDRHQEVGGAASGVQAADRERERFRPDVEPSSDAVPCGLGNTQGAGPQGERGISCSPIGHERWGQPGLSGYAWNRFDVVPCRDGKVRRVESGTFPLATGVPARVGRLRGYGNSISPQAAAIFIKAYLEAQGEHLA